MNKQLLISLILAFLAPLGTFAPTQAQDVFSRLYSSTNVYTTALEKKITKHWHAPKGKRWADLIVNFEVSKDGVVSLMKISHSSGFPVIDKLAMQSIQKAAPFPVLPTGIPSANFELHFDSQLPPESSPAAPTEAAVSDSNFDPVTLTFKSATVEKKQHQDIDFGPYMANLQQQIKRAWHPVETSDPVDVKVTFDISKTGQISHAHISHSSGNTMVDKADLDAVQNAAPFEQLPDGSPPVVDQEFWFKHSGRLGWNKEGKYWVGRVGRNPINEI